MKEVHSTLRKIVILILTGVFISGLQASVIPNSTNKITVNKKTKVLTAPQAESYKWFLNGKELADNGEVLEVKESGEYKVILTDKEGKVTDETIHLQVSGTGDIIVIYTIGDSTVQNYAEGYYPRTGWGQVLQYFFDENYVTVDNRAVGGTSAKSFYNQYWKVDGTHQQIVSEIDSGDFVLIQFGINDAKSDDTARYTEPFGSFKDYLTKYVNEAKQKGANPVIVSTLRRNAYNDDGVTVYNAYHNYPIAAIELSNTLDVPLINLHDRCASLMEELGKAYTTSYWYNNYVAGEYPKYPTGNKDDVHFQEMGAIEMARLVASELINDTSASIEFLSQYIIKDTFQVTVLQNDSEAGMVTRTASYPKDTPVTLKAKTNGGYKFVDWKNESGESVSTNQVYTFATKQDSNTTYTANFEYVGYGESKVWIEAEWGEVGSLWNIVEDELASNGKHVTIKPGSNSPSSAPSTSGQISYKFNTEEGMYNLYLRVLLPSVTDDSFWMKLDDGTWSKVTWEEAYTEWTWKEVIALTLSEGEHELKIAYREDGALLDKVHIGNDLPSGIGEIDSSYYKAPPVVVVGIQENIFENSFSQRVWTDASQEINITYNVKNATSIDYEVYNSAGQLVYQESLGYLNAGVYTYGLKPSLNMGLYILKTNVDGKHKSSKFVIR